MTEEDRDESSFLGGRVAGAVVVGAGTYGVLWYWDTWGLSQEVRAGIVIALGWLFLICGRNVGRWIDHVEFWSKAYAERPR